MESNHYSTITMDATIPNATASKCGSAKSHCANPFWLDSVRHAFYMFISNEKKIDTPIDEWKFVSCRKVHAHEWAPLQSVPSVLHSAAASIHNPHFFLIWKRQKLVFIWIFDCVQLHAFGFLWDGRVSPPAEFGCQF